MTVQTQQPPKNPTLAAILSFLINGLGQVYNGQIGKGILIFVIQIVNALLTTVIIGFITLPIVWIWSIYDAYKVAQRINEEAAQHVVETTKTCPRCAERVNTGAKVCHFCGYEFLPEAAALTAPRTPVTEQPSGIATPAVAGVPVAAAASQPATVEAKTCPQCGSTSQLDARFCMSCGYSFAAESSSSSTDGIQIEDEMVVDEPVVES